MKHKTHRQYEKRCALSAIEGFYFKKIDDLRSTQEQQGNKSQANPLDTLFYHLDNVKYKNYNNDNKYERYHIILAL